jgi:hypothetical protein
VPRLPWRWLVCRGLFGGNAHLFGLTWWNSTNAVGWRGAVQKDIVGI